MATKPLCNTLRQLHVKLQDRRFLNGYSSVFDETTFMPSLHTFTSMKPLYCQSNDEWTFIDILTSTKVMPVLKQVRFICGITRMDLNRIAQSTISNDDRHVDVQYAFLLNDNDCHSELTKRVPRGSRSHPRSIACATFYRNNSHRDPKHDLPDAFGIYDDEGQSHLWYTLPWAFNDFLQLSVPDTCITRLQMSSSLFVRQTSRIRKMRLIRNAMTPFIAQSSLVCPDRIELLDLFYCDRSISLKLPSLVHVNLVDSFDALQSCHLVSMHIQSITIVMHQQEIESASNRWTDLRVLSDLPRLRSVRVLLYSTLVCPDDIGCQMLAETSLLVSDFGISFREDLYLPGVDRKLLCDMYRLFIKELHRKMICLSPNQKSSYVIEKNGCGLIFWR
uniref:Uncharacterized protein n=1 Tax=Philodina roseola TaxID=96448 RepID=B6S360_PHIRO|nr:hypothetical protein [Philodina roseola]